MTFLRHRLSSCSSHNNSWVIILQIWTHHYLHQWAARRSVQHWRWIDRDTESHLHACSQGAFGYARRQWNFRLKHVFPLPPSLCGLCQSLSISAGISRCSWPEDASVVQLQYRASLHKPSTWLSMFQCRAQVPSLLWLHTVSQTLLYGNRVSNLSNPPIRDSHPQAWKQFTGKSYCMSRVLIVLSRSHFVS